MSLDHPRNQPPSTSGSGPEFIGFVFEVFKDGTEVTLLPLLLGIALGGGAGWYLAATHFPGGEYLFVLVGLIAGFFAGIIFATAAAGFIAGWIVGALAEYGAHTFLGMDKAWIGSVPSYVGAGLGALFGLLGTVQSLTNTCRRWRERKAAGK